MGTQNVAVQGLCMPAAQVTVPQLDVPQPDAPQLHVSQLEAKIIPEPSAIIVKPGAYEVVSRVYAPRKLEAELNGQGGVIVFLDYGHGTLQALVHIPKGRGIDLLEECIGELARQSGAPYDAVLKNTHATIFCHPFVSQGVGLLLQPTLAEELSARYKLDRMLLYDSQKVIIDNGSPRPFEII